MSDIGTIAATVGGVVGALTPLGGGVAFVWGKIERRFQVLEGKLEETEKKLATANQQLVECRARDQKKDVQMGGLVWALRMLAAEVSGSDAQSPLLAEVRQILKEFGVHPHIVEPAEPLASA